MPRRSNRPREIERATPPQRCIRVVTEQPLPHGARSVSVGIWIGTGSREEADHQTGISHFVEHMVFKGTKNRSAEQIARSVDSIGGGLDAFTSKELVSYNVKVLDEHLPDAFDVIADLVRNPLFKKDDIEKEKGVILEELKMEVDNPEYLIHEIFASNFWKGHPLGRPILGTRQTIRSFDRDTVDRYYRQFYVPSNILVTAAGSLDHQRLVNLVEDQFADLKPRKASKLAGPPSRTRRWCFGPRIRWNKCTLYVGVRIHRDRARRRALRLLHPQRDSGRRDELASVPEHSRTPGPRLYGLFRAEHVSRRGLHAGVMQAPSQAQRGQSGQNPIAPRTAQAGR